MAFGVTTEGFVIKPLATIRQEVEDSQRQDIDPGLDLSDQSVMGQINGTLSAQIAELWELAQAVYGSQYPDSANGASLNNVSSITGTKRSGAEKTLVENVSVTLNPNSPLPIGSVANVSNQPAARFVSLAALPGSVAGGVFEVDFEAESTGAIVVPLNGLNEIAEPVPGWTSITNSQNSGVTGAATEDDADLRVKREVELEAQGSTNVDAIRADVSKLTGVVDVAVFENDTDVIAGDGTLPHSVRVVVRGGTAQEIADQIFISKAAGINTNGALSNQVLDSQGFGHTVRHDQASPLDFYAILECRVDPLTFDTVNGIDEIKANIAAYINALGVGADVIFDQVKCEALDVVGVVKFDSVLIGFGVADQTVDLPVGTDQFAQSDVANLNVTTDLV